MELGYTITDYILVHNIWYNADQVQIIIGLKDMRHRYYFKDGRLATMVAPSDKKDGGTGNECNGKNNKNAFGNFTSIP